MLFSFMQPRLWGALALGIVLGVVLAAVLIPTQPPADTPSINPSPKVLYWYDPMAPNQHFDKPGKSPFMDMELVPKYAEESAASSGLMIDAAQVQNLGMRVARVKSIPVQIETETTGQLRANERELVIIQLPVAGFVEKAWPLAVGDYVEAGQPLAEVSIPEWLRPQNELLAVRPNDDPRLLDFNRQRLRLLGMDKDLIAQIEKNHAAKTTIILRAPMSGAIESLVLKAGSSWQSGQTLVRIQGLQQLWLDVAVPLAQANNLGKETQIRFYPSATSTPAVNTTLGSVLPDINPMTRTVTARAVLANENRLFKPGDIGRVRMTQPSSGLALAVPSEAIIRTGKRTLVMLSEGHGQFRPQEVKIGHDLGDMTLILGGLREHQEVVASGQFLLDSEASLRNIVPETNQDRESVSEEPIHTQHRMQETSSEKMDDHATMDMESQP